MNDSQTPSQDETAIRELVEAWAHAVRRRDLPAILHDHAPDILMFDVPPPFESRGLDAYARTWERFHAWAHTPATFDIRHMDVTAGSDVAFVAAAMRCAGTEATGEQVELDFRLTIGLRKVDGRWVVVHEHHSVPATD